MNINGLLQYASIDDEMAALNREFNAEPSVKEYKLQSKRKKDALDMLARCNAEAGEMMGQMNTLQDKFAELSAQLAEAESNVAHIEDENEADYYCKNVEKLIVALSQLSQDIAALGKKIADMRVQYANVLKVGADAGKRLNEVREAYNEVVKAYQPKVDEIKKRLAAAAVGLESEVQLYASLRKAGVKNPLVPIRSNTCGGCFMEVDAHNVNKLHADGCVVCQNCGRIIYEKA